MPEKVVCAGGVLVREQKLLLARRSDDREFYPGVWDVVGGHLEPSESAAEALVRELGEEIGVRALVFEEIAVRDADGYRLHLFVVTEWRGEPRIANAEHAELRWLTLDELSELPLAHPEYPRLLRTALSGEVGSP